ncbi:MAG: tail fiber domain-containing protein [Muribaculaceae bacterium]|nr:tail fiber domain-containing protein [Muribaculaceae bacterium]MDE5971227.1 tail fiber domain-containing protein [Muribaculaceae bacterium]
MKQNNLLPIFVLLCFLCSTFSPINGQIKYSEGHLTINNSTPTMALTIADWDGLYWTNQGCLFMISLNGPDPAISGNNNVLFYNYITRSYNNIHVKSVYNTSDARLKENIKPLSFGISPILKLNPVSFTWKKTINDDTLTASTKGAKLSKNQPQQSQFGFLAQEVEEIFPSLVSEDDTGNKLVNYTAMIPLIIQAIKDLHTTISEQEETIQYLSSIIEQNHVQSSTSSHFQCYPSPTTNTLNIKLLDIPQCNSAKITISSTSGISEKQIDVFADNEMTIDVSDLKKGIHLLTLYIDNQTYDSARFIKN